MELNKREVFIDLKFKGFLSHEDPFNYANHDEVTTRLTNQSLNQLIVTEGLAVERNREERRTSDLIYHLEIMAALEELRKYRDAVNVNQLKLLPCPACGSEAHFDPIRQGGTA